MEWIEYLLAALGITAGGGLAIVLFLLQHAAVPLLKILLKELAQKTKSETWRNYALEAVALAEELAARDGAASRQKLETAVEHLLRQAPQLDWDEAEILIHAALGASSYGASGPKDGSPGS